MDTQPLATLRSADLADPFYYLHNARTLLSWVMHVHDDLLLADETQQLKQLLSLPEDAQALLFRMVMRKGEWFRSDQLGYAEIPHPAEALKLLEHSGLIDTQPNCDADTLTRLLRKQELVKMCQTHCTDQPVSNNSRKQELADLLQALDLPAQPASDWWPEAPFQLIRLSCMPLMDRMRLMFFGNLHQDWSEFVLTELGHQQYERVQLDPDNRAFSHRSEVDLYLQLHLLHQQLEEGVEAEQLSVHLPAPSDTDWLENRRQKLAFAFGQTLERQGLLQAALQLYRDNPHREARIRHLRLLEKTAPAEETCQVAEAVLAQISQPEARVRIQRILQRSARKAALSIPAPPKTAIPQQTLELSASDTLNVEALVIEHLKKQGFQAWHVENRLFTGLFALLFWPALFAPVKGAFFHPFQAGPADLYRPDFVIKRQPLIDDGFRQLADGSYRDSILQVLEQKRGTRCSLVHWPSLESDLVEQALTCIPAAHLSAIFKHLLLDLRHHRRGLPDLLVVYPERHDYQLIEVKGPNDRLQDHQRLWMEFFLAQGITATLCQVRFKS